MTDTHDLSFDDQVSKAIGLVKNGHLTLAAAAVGGFTRVTTERPTEDIYAMELSDYVACVLIELESGRQRSALVALESIRSIYRSGPHLSLIDGGASCPALR